jgi:adenosylmethionine-8-amino-7-oxononanoate aminotransferase
VNAYNVPDRVPIPEYTAPDNSCGTVDKRHWDAEWSVDAISKASQDNVMFTWAPSDPARAGCPLIKEGKGCYVYDYDGKEYLDWTAQAVCNNLGHTPPQAVKDAVAKQLDTLPYVYSGLAVTEHRARLSNLLAELLAGDLNGFLFPSSGAVANAGALRIARRFTGKHKIMSRYRSYHGGTATAMAATGDFRRHFAETGQAGFVKIADPNPFGFSWGDTDEEACERSLGSLHEQILMEGPETIAGIILEHVPGSGGVLLPPKGYTEGVQALCKQYGILLIADEVMTGFGRTGEMFGFQNFDVQPDIVTFAKGITAAWIPMSGIACSKEIQDHFRDVPLGYGATYNAHPVSVACAYEVIKYTLEADVLGNVKALAPVLEEEMQRLVDEHDCIRQARTVGLFGGCDIVNTTGPDAGNRVSSLAGGGPAADKINLFKKAMKDEGLISLFRNCMIHVAPPLIITEPELRDGFNRLHRALKTANF